MNAWRRTFGVTTRQCLRTAGPATLAAAIVAAVAGELTAPVLADEAATGAQATLWLALPLLVAAAASCLTAARTWPTFALRQDGADAVRRITRGPLGGRGAAALGAVTAQLALSLPATLLLAPMLEVPATARRYVQAAVSSPPVLDRAGAILRCELPEPVLAAKLLLRPRAALPTGPDATRVQVTSGGAPLHEDPLRFEQSLELVELSVDERELQGLTLTQLDGHVPLLFVDGSVTVVSSEELPRWSNAAMLVAIACAASLAALALGGLLGLRAGWPTVASVIAAGLFVQWIGGVGPLHAALLAFARGQWLA